MDEPTAGAAATTTTAAIDITAPAAEAPASALGSGATAAAAPAAPAVPGPFGAIPEKYQVKASDGTPDLIASAAKLAEGHASLEQRMGAGDVRPKAAADYKLNLPESLKGKIDAEALSKDPKTIAWLADAHAKGMTQTQLDFTIGSMLEQVAGLTGGLKQSSADECTAELRKGWTTEAEYQAQISKAFRAGKTYGGADFDAILKDYGNDARIVRLLANVGKDLGEDTGTPNLAAGISELDVTQLQASAAYWEPNDPLHASTKAKVTAFYEQKFRGAPRTGAVVSSLQR